MKVTIRRNEGVCEFLEEVKTKVFDDEFIKKYLKKYNADLIFCSKNFMWCADYKTYIK